MSSSNTIFLDPLEPLVFSSNNYIVPNNAEFKFREYDKSVKILGTITKTLVDFREDRMSLKIPRGWTTRASAKDIHDAMVKSLISFGTSTLTIRAGNKIVFECSMKKPGLIHSYKKLKPTDKQFLKHLAEEIRKTMLAEAIVTKKLHFI